MKVQERLAMGRRMDGLIEKMFLELEQLLSAAEVTSELLGRSIQRIIIQGDGKCEVFLKLFEELGHVNRGNLVGKFKL